MRNCHLALRRAVTFTPPFRSVVITEPHRALSVADVADVLIVRLWLPALSERRLAHLPPALAEAYRHHTCL